MEEIEFVDVTLRDGHQSLWATRMSAPMMLPIAPVIDDAGFHCIQVGSSGNHFVAYSRYLRENPWEKLRLLRRAMQKTPLHGALRSRGVWSFGVQPDSVVELFIRRLAAYGIDRIGIFDPLHDFDNIREPVRIIHECGSEFEGCLVYCISPVHTDEYYAQKAAELAALKADFVLIKDSIGLLTPERVKTLVPAILPKLGGIPLEIHSHCSTGLAPLCYVEAVKAGVRTVHTASTPLANGNSLPSVETTLKNVKRLGFSSKLDEKALAKIAAHFNYVAKKEGKPVGVPVEYDLSQYDHHVPGGMRSNLESMLSIRGDAHRLEEVLEETARVRKELGYPVLITPLAQIIGTQAVMNVVSGDRYSLVSDETYKYCLGWYGKTVAPIEPNVLDRIFSSARGKEFLSWQLPQPTLTELRTRFGGRLDDDQLLLQLMLPEETVDGIIGLTSTPIKTDYPLNGLDSKEAALVKSLAQWAQVSYMHYEKGDLSLTLQKHR